MKSLLPLALSALLLPAVLPAQEAQGPKPAAEAQPAQPPPEKKPDAFQYFFGKKRDERAPQPEVKKPLEPRKPGLPAKAPDKEPVVKPAAKAVEVKPVEAAPVKAPEAPARTVAAPAIPAPPAPASPPAVAPSPEPAKAEPAAKEEGPKVDAFQYFFGQGAQPAPKAAKPQEDAAPRAPVNAFDYFFGKDGKADEAEPASPPPS
jgi:hypothetical protein